MVPLFYSASSLLPPSATGMSAAAAAACATTTPTTTVEGTGSTNGAGSDAGADATVVAVHVPGVGHVDVICDSGKGPRVVNRDGSTGYLQNWSHLRANEQHRAHALAEVAAGNHRNLHLLLDALYESKESKEDKEDQADEAEEWDRGGDDGRHTREHGNNIIPRAGATTTTTTVRGEATRRFTTRRRLDFNFRNAGGAAVPSAAARLQSCRDRAPL